MYEKKNAKICLETNKKKMEKTTYISNFETNDNQLINVQHNQI